MYKIYGDPKISKTLICLFVSSSFFACTFSISGLLDKVGGHQFLMIDEFVKILSFSCFFQSLLWTLVIRLHITFKPSQYCMSLRTMIVFKVIILVQFIGWIVYCSLYVFMKQKLNPLVSLSFDLLLFLFYIIGSGLAVYLFLHKLSQIGKDRAKYAIHQNISPQTVQLDRAQQSFSKLSAKYLLLFAIATISTILAHFLGYCVNIESGLRSPILAVDVCVNLFTILLQFGFMGDTYRKCCRCCDVKCSHYMSLRTKSAIYRNSIVMSSDVQEEAHILKSSNDGRTEEEDQM